MRAHYLNDEIKWTDCHECGNKKGCQRKYRGIFVHSGVPEACIIENKFEKEKERE